MYQIVGFHFRVNFSGLPNSTNVDIAFKSISGLNVNTKTETFKEGGENRFVHVLPLRETYTPLVLKRGVLKTKDSSLAQWCEEAFLNHKKEPLNTLSIELLNDNHTPLINWQVFNVWPLRWEIAKLNAEKSEVLIEKLVLNYNYFKRVKIN